jgi:hypothetical protein
MVRERLRDGKEERRLSPLSIASTQVSAGFFDRRRSEHEFGPTCRSTALSARPSQRPTRQFLQLKGAIRDGLASYCRTPHLRPAHPAPGSLPPLALPLASGVDRARRPAHTLDRARGAHVPRAEPASGQECPVGRARGPHAAARRGRPL